MKLSSNSFKNEESIPERYTCNEENIFPDLIIEDIPEKAKSFALIMEDPDAPSGTFVHWLIWNIPLEKTRISEGELLNCPQGKNDLGNFLYPFTMTLFKYLFLD